VNLLPVQAAVMIDTERVLLDAGQSAVRPLEAGKDKPVQVAFRNPDDGSFRPFYHGSALVNPGERAQAIIFRADGENPRSPAKVMIYNEEAPRAEPKPAL
jgi:hypothetical protein